MLYYAVARHHQRPAAMKCALFALLFCCQTAFSQSQSGTTTTYVKELGWTIKLPPGFKVIDTATLNAESRALESEIHWIKKPNPADTNYSHLVLWARDNDKNSFIITCIDSSHLKPPDSLRKQPGTVGTRTTREATYDGVTFTLVRIEMNTPPHPYIRTSCSTGYKGKKYTISFAVPDTAMEQTFLQVLQTSTFDR
jgi:hypothetical protein